MNVNSASYDSSVYDLLKKGLDASALRSKVIANNIANVNTAGYKRYYVSFEDTLKDAQDSLDVNGGSDAQSDSDYGTITVKQDTSTSMNSDGNNVDIDNEMSNQAANTLMYNALVTQANARLSMTSYVITGGGGSN